MPEHGDDLLHCERCGDEIGEWTLVYVDSDNRPVCDGCEEGDIAGVGYIKNWYDKPIHGDLNRQEITKVKRVPTRDIVTDGGSARPEHGE